MEQSPALSAAIVNWTATARLVVDRASGIARLTGEQFGELGDNRIALLEREVAALDTMSDRVYGLLSAHLREDNDDAIDRMQALLFGNLVTVDVLNTAAEEPDYIVASLRLNSMAEFSVDSWYGDIQRAAAGMSGIKTLGGAATAPPDTLLEAAITKLTDAAGSEIVSIATDAAVTVALPMAGHTISTAVSHVLAGSAGGFVRSAAQEIKGIFVAAKRAAGKVVAWVVDHAKDVLPSALASVIPSAIQSISEAVFQDAIPRAVGRVAADLFGKKDVESAWRHALPSAVEHAHTKLDSATANELRRIGTVTRCRVFIDKWLRWLLAPASTLPQVAIGVLVVVVAALLFVAAQLWAGLRGIKRLV